MRVLLSLTTAVLFFSFPSIVDGTAQKTKITEIDYHLGGNQWYNLNLAITRDSIIFSEYSRSRGKTNRKLVTNIKSWNALMDAIDLKAFDRIKSAESENYIDGIDEGIIIKTQTNPHSVLLDRNNRAPVENLLQQINGLIDRIKNTNPETITEIIYDYGGNQAGNTTLTITSDSIYYDSNRGNDAGKFRETDNKQTWNNLIAAIDLSACDTIKNGPNRREVDGTNYILTIKTSSKTRWIIIDSKNRRQIAMLVTQLEAILASLRPKNG